MIPSHLSILRGFTSKVSIFGCSVDIQDFVQKHKSALDDVITQINENLCIDIKHIERILDNATRGISEKLTSIIEKICRSFRSEIVDFEVRLRLSLNPVLEELQNFKSTYSEMIEKYIGHHERLINLLENYILVFEGMRRYLGSFDLPDPITKEKIYRRGRHKGEKKDKENFIKELNKFLLDKTLRSKVIDEGIKAAKEFKNRASEIGEILTENSIDFRPPELGGENTYSNQLAILRNYKAKFQESIPKIGEMERSIDKLRGLEDFLKSILEIRSKATRREMKGSLNPKFVKFIDGLPYTRIKLIHFKSELKDLKKISEYIIYKLKNATNLVKYFRFVSSKIKTLSDYQTCFSPDDIGVIISKLLQFKQNVRNKVSYVNMDLKKFRIEGFVIKGQKQPESFMIILGEIQRKILKNLESYIRKLRAIKTIKGYLESIKKKKGELSSAKSNIGGITNVDHEITQLRKVQKTIEKFEPIIGTINSIRPLYHFERSTFEDIDEHVEVLMTTKEWLMVLRSDIESYIEFLEKIKGPSSELERIYSRSSSLPSIGDISYRLGLKIWQIIVELEKIKANISEMNTMRHELKIEEMKQNISEIKYRIHLVENSHFSIQKVLEGMKSIRSDIALLFKTIYKLDLIGCYIEMSKSILTDTRISYRKPSSVSIRYRVGCLSRIRTEVDIINLNTIQPIYEIIQPLTSEINNLEQKICSFMNPFLECSIKSTISTLES